MRQTMFAREHILAAVAVTGVLILAAAAALLLQRRQSRPEPAPRFILTIPNFGPVQLATPEARERMRRAWEKAPRTVGR